MSASRPPSPWTIGRFRDTLLSMGASLKTVEATIDADGTIHLSEPLQGPARAVVTVLIEDLEPNDTTVAAIRESLEKLPRYSSIEGLLEDLDS